MIQLNQCLKAQVLICGFTALLPLNVVAADDPIFNAPSLNFFTQYDGDGVITRSSITLYSKKRETQGRYTIESALPLDIKQALFSPHTQNPFKKAYATFYTAANFKQLQTCSLIGANFNLDNNLKTEEWYVATSATGCIKEQAHIDGGTSHNWIIQRDEQGQFRIVMESYGSLTVEPATQQSPYKPLSTTHHVMRFMPQSALGCGDVYIKWRYNKAKQQYQHTFYNPRIAGCSQKFSYEIVTDPGAKKAIAAVNQIVRHWIKNNLPAFR